MPRRLTWLLIALAACSKSEDAPRSTVAPPATASASAAPTGATPTDIPKLPEPRAEDLVPKDEAIAGSMLVDAVADGYRYQIPAGFRPTTDPTSGPWTGKVKGATEDATLTIFAARTKFKGDIDALVASETKDIQAGGGKVELTGPVLVWIAGRSEPARARRLLGRTGGTLDYRVLVVRAPNAYVFHCQTPTLSATGGDAWTNVGVECMSRGTTFHVAPPVH